jgi:hypothetical protein
VDQVFTYFRLRHNIFTLLFTLPKIAELLQLREGEEKMRYRMMKKFLDEEAIKEGRPVEVDIMDEMTRGWLHVKAIIYKEPVEGAEETGILDEIGVLTKERVYLKIEEELSDEELVTYIADESYSGPEK